MSRVARIGGGTALIVVGIPMLVLPGPGLATIVAGLAVLAPEVRWARRLLDKAKTRRTPNPARSDQDGV